METRIESLTGGISTLRMAIIQTGKNGTLGVAYTAQVEKVTRALLQKTIVKKKTQSDNNRIEVVIVSDI